MEDSGIVDEREPGRKNSAHAHYGRTGWEAVVFEIEEIELPEPGADETVAGGRLPVTGTVSRSLRPG